MIINWLDEELEAKVVERRERLYPKRDVNLLRKITLSEHDYYLYELKYRHGIILNDLWMEYWSESIQEIQTRVGITDRFNYFWDAVDYMASIY